MPLALWSEEPGTYRERLPRVESSPASTEPAERIQAVGMIREPRGRTSETSQRDDPRQQTDEVSLHGGGRPGPVLRWNPKTRERSVDQLVWGRCRTIRTTLPLRSARSRQGRKPWPRTALGAEEAELTPAGLYPSVTGSAGRRRPAVSHRDAVKPD